jgi:hypothetical protein
MLSFDGCGVENGGGLVGVGSRRGVERVIRKEKKRIELE